MLPTQLPSASEKVFADFSIETLLKKTDNRLCHDSKNWGNVNSYSSQLVSALAINGQMRFVEDDDVTDKHQNLLSESFSRHHHEERQEVIHRTSDIKRKKIFESESQNNGIVYDWLSCTRFKPPKLPRTRRRNASKRHGRGPRIPFSTHQQAVLEAHFVNSQYLSSEAIARLAEALHLTETRVKIWFQNRRARYRREQESPSLFSSSTVKAKSSVSVSHTKLPASSAMTFGEKVHYYLCSTPSSSSAQTTPTTEKQSLRHLINDLNLMAAANSPTCAPLISPSSTLIKSASLSDR